MAAPAHSSEWIIRAVLALAAVAAMTRALGVGHWRTPSVPEYFTSPSCFLGADTMTRDTSTLDAAVKGLETGVNTGDDLQSVLSSAQASLLKVTSDSNTAIQTAQKAVSDATAAVQANATDLANKRAAVDAAMASLLLPLPADAGTQAGGQAGSTGTEAGATVAGAIAPGAGATTNGAAN
jgi:hypothetical protein